MGLAEEILAFEDRKPVEVQAWGKTLWLVPMSGTDRDAYDAERVEAFESEEQDGNGHVTYWRSRYLVRCLFDKPPADGGTRVFTNQQAAQLAEKSGETMNRLWKIASKEDGTEPGAITAAAKNS